VGDHLSIKWYITAALLIALGFMLKAWFTREEGKDWVESTWGFMKQIFPLLAGGVLVAGFMLGRPGNPALIPEHFIESLLGGNSLTANLIAALAGALMYFATLTEVPILQGLLGAGMGQGPALALAAGRPGAVSAQHAGDRQCKCQQAEKVVREAVAESGVNATVEKVTDLMKIAGYGVFGTPAVVVDGDVKMVGKVPKKEDVLSWLNQIRISE
jgi:small redox-active disulfide protein 2